VSGPSKIGSLMLIDDDLIDQKMYRRMIERSGLVDQLTCFSLAEQALAHLQANPRALPDVILLDINMPRMDGFEFLEAVDRIFGADFTVVVVMLTTSLDPGDVDRAGRFDVVKKYIDKPLTQRAHARADHVDLIGPRASLYAARKAQTGRSGYCCYTGQQ